MNSDDLARKVENHAERLQSLERQYDKIMARLDRADEEIQETKVLIVSQVERIHNGIAKLDAKVSDFKEVQSANKALLGVTKWLIGVIMAASLGVLAFLYQIHQTEMENYKNLSDRMTNMSTKIGSPNRNR